MSEESKATPYTVVVGVSITSKSPAALQWAAAQAQANDGRLIAVRVLDAAPGPGRDAGAEAARAGDVQQLEADVAETLGEDPGAELRVVYGAKRATLLAVAERADLLVIDTASHPSSSSRLARRIISSASCPVVVMPPAITGELASGLARAGRAAGSAALRAVGTSGRPGYRRPAR